MKVVVCKGAEEVAGKAADMFIQQVKAKPSSVLGFATGSTPEKTYAKMAEACKRGEVSFAGVRTFNLDEYWGLGGDHDQSYRRFMNDRLFGRIDVRPWNTFVPDGRAASAALECEAYERKILAVGGVDLWILGIGGNGHVGFNEPGSSVDSRTRLVSLTQSTIDANSDGRFFSDPDEVPRCALTAGVATIREAGKLMLLATGAGKADAIAAAIEGPFTPSCPASLLQDHPDITFLVDAEAGAKLRKKHG